MYNINYYYSQGRISNKSRKHSSLSMIWGWGIVFRRLEVLKLYEAVWCICVVYSAQVGSICVAYRLIME